MIAYLFPRLGVGLDHPARMRVITGAFHKDDAPMMKMFLLCTGNFGRSRMGGGFALGLESTARFVSAMSDHLPGGGP